jgi:hypothetical protein
MNLLDLMSVEYRRSRSALYGSLIAGAVVYGLVLVDVVTSHSISRWLAPSALALQILALLLKQRSSIRYGAAEEIRRLMVLEEGLGVEPSQIVIAEIVARSGNASPPKRVHVGKYFASEEPPGVARLLEHVEESSFWTHHIASFAGNLAFGLVIIGVGISLWALVAFINAGVSASALQAAAEAVVATLGFVVAGDFLVLSLEYRQLGQDARRTMGEASGQSESGKMDRESAILLFGEYNCNLSGSPPLPSFFYKLRHERLARGWAARVTKVPVE